DPGRRRRRPSDDPVQGRARGLQALDAPARARAAAIDRGQWPGIAPRSRHRARHIERRLSPGSGNGRVAARGRDETVVAVGDVRHRGLVMHLEWSVADVLDRLAPPTDEALTGAARARLHALAVHLPAALTRVVYLESWIGQPRPRLDLIVKID